MKSSGSEAKKKAFVQTVQEQVGRLAEHVYEWMAEAERGLSEVEGEVTEVMRQIGQGLLCAACQLSVPSYPEPEIACACGEQAAYIRLRTGQMKTQLGQLHFKRPYYLCAHCGQGTYPQDEALGFCAGSISAGLDELLAYVGSLLPFDEAAGLLEKLSGLHVSSRRIRQSTERLGQRVQAQEEQAIAAAWAGTEPLAPPAPQAAPQRLSISMDGMIVLMRHQQGKEQKLGAVYTTRAKPSPQRPQELEVRAEQISFYTAQADAATFGRGLWLEAQRRGVAQAEEVVVIGDGAHWIWRLAEEHFPDATQILDWYHASQYVWQAARAIYGETSEMGKQWAQHRLDQLWDGQVDPLLSCLKEHDRHRAVQETIAYFTHNRQRMDYPHYRALGLQIGSGTIESGCKHVIAHRLKQAGMRWSEEGAQAVAKLRARLKSNRWDETAQLLPPPSRSYNRSAA
jgi:hypothetical protein